MEIGKKRIEVKEMGYLGFIMKDGGVEEHIVERKAMTRAMKKTWRNIREKLFRNNYKK